MMNKSFIFVAVPLLTGMGVIFFGSSLNDVCALAPDPNFGSAYSDCYQNFEFGFAVCCWTEKDAEGIEIKYCQGCVVNTDTGDFEDCGEVTQVSKGLPKSTLPPEPGGLKDDGTTTEKPKFPGKTPGLNPQLLAPTNDTNNDTNVKKDLGRQNDGGPLINPGEK